MNRLSQSQSAGYISLGLYLHVGCVNYFSNTLYTRRQGLEIDPKLTADPSYRDPQNRWTVFDNYDDRTNVNKQIHV